jgi:predicted dehydrogenase
MTDPLRVVLVGVGRRGASWVKAFRNVPVWEPVALVDVDPAFLEAAGEMTGVPESACFTALTPALEEVEADAVSIVVPAHLHAQFIDQALRADKHVLVEKPFTTNLAVAERLVALAAQRKRTLLVTQTARYGRLIRTLQRLVAEEVYGPLGFMSYVYHKARRGPYPHMEHMHLWGQGVHELDAMCAIAGRPVVSVMGRSVLPPWSTWPSESLAEALITFGPPYGPRPDRLGPRELAYGTYVGTSEARAPGSLFRIECRDAALVAERSGKSIQMIHGKESEEIGLDELSYSSTDEYLTQVFHRAVTTGEEPETSGRRNLDTMRLCDAIIRSGETGHSIQLTSTGNSASS